MNILFIVPYTPNLIRVRPYNLIRFLNRHGHQVTVATLYSNDAEKRELAQLKTESHAVYAQKLSKLMALFNCSITVPTKRPLQASYCWNPDLARQLETLVSQAQYQFDIIHIEHLRGARYGLYLNDYMASKAFQKHRIPIVWDSVDCITLLFKQAARKSQSLKDRMILSFEVKRTENYEKWLVNQFNKVLVTSVIDRNALQELRGLSDRQLDITVVPNGVDLDYFLPDSENLREAATLVVSGKMSYHANIAMVLDLVNNIMPRVWAQAPEIKLWIVGKDPPEIIKKLSQNQAIAVTGAVNDIRPYLQNATISVAPITYGAGIQNKILEAMACQIPVVATSQAALALSAIPDRDIIIKDGAENFANAIVHLLHNKDQQSAIGQGGRAYVEKNHNWNTIITLLEQKYLDAIGSNGARI